MELVDAGSVLECAWHSVLWGAVRYATITSRFAS